MNGTLRASPTTLPIASFVCVSVVTRGLSEQTVVAVSGRAVSARAVSEQAVSEQAHEHRIVKYWRGDARIPSARVVSGRLAEGMSKHTGSCLEAGFVRSLKHGSAELT